MKFEKYIYVFVFYGLLLLTNALIIMKVLLPMWSGRGDFDQDLCIMFWFWLAVADFHLGKFGRELLSL